MTKNVSWGWVLAGVTAGLVTGAIVTVFASPFATAPESREGSNTREMLLSPYADQIQDMQADLELIRTTLARPEPSPGATGDPREAADLLKAANSLEALLQEARGLMDGVRQEIQQIRIQLAEISNVSSIPPVKRKGKDADAVARAIALDDPKKEFFCWTKRQVYAEFGFPDRDGPYGDDSMQWTYELGSQRVVFIFAGNLVRRAYATTE